MKLLIVSRILDFISNFYIAVYSCSFTLPSLPFYSSFREIDLHLIYLFNIFRTEYIEKYLSYFSASFLFKKVIFFKELT